MSTPRIIAVVGGNKVGETTLQHARALGAEIARRGAILLTGGDGRNPDTVKDAAIQGAGADAKVISMLKENGGVRGSAVRSGWRHGRNILNALASDAMIVLDGGGGTMSEAAFAQMLGRPVVVFDNARLTDTNLQAIVRQSAARQEVLPAPCTVENVKRYAAEALERGFRTSDVREAVEHAMRAPLSGFLPEIDGVDPAEYHALLRRYGRTPRRLPHDK